MKEPLTVEKQCEVYRAARLLVEHQALDDGLWFIAETAPEAYLQQELRRLHELIEGKTSIECALEILNEEEPR